MEKRENMELAFIKLSENKQVKIWNEFCRDCYYEEIHSMDDFDIIFMDTEPSKLVLNLDNSFNINDLYFIINDLGKIISTNEPIYEMDLDELFDYMINANEDYGFDIFREILDENE